MIGGVRPVAGVSAPAAHGWLRRRRRALAAQHAALDEGRIDDLVRLLHDEEESPGHSEGDESPAEGPANPLAHEVQQLADQLEARITRLRGETLAELRELEGRMAAARIGSGQPGDVGGRRGGTFNGYL